MEVREADDKRALLNELLEQGMVLVTVDARNKSVDVPSYLRNDAQLRLNLSYRFGLPISLLTFNGQAYECCLPWTAIYLLFSKVSGRTVLFPSDVPPEFFPTGISASLTSAPAGATEVAPQAPERPRFSVVSGEAEADVSQPPEDPAPRTPPKRGHLRVVK
jgi:stringent starvation protein B